MAAKAKAIGDMEEQLANLTGRIEALERVYFEVAYKGTALQRAVLEKP